MTACAIPRIPADRGRRIHRTRDLGGGPEQPERSVRSLNLQIADNFRASARLPQRSAGLTVTTNFRGLSGSNFPDGPACAQPVFDRESTPCAPVRSGLGSPLSGHVVSVGHALNSIEGVPTSRRDPVAWNAALPRAERPRHAGNPDRVNTTVFPAIGTPGSTIVRKNAAPTVRTEILRARFLGNSTQVP